MAQSSSAERIVDVVEFLGSQPDRDFTLSELCRRLELSKATAHALLATLTERGWVVRHPRDKTYRLGPALTTIAGAAGARQLEVVDYARDEMQELAKDLNVQCVASAVLGDDIVLLAVAGSSRPLSIHVQAGQRIPLAPPLGTVFLAWAGPTRIDRWLRKLGPNATEAQLAGYRAAVDRVRERGTRFLWRSTLGCYWSGRWPTATDRCRKCSRSWANRSTCWSTSSLTTPID